MIPLDREKAEPSDTGEWERQNFALKISELPDAEEFLKWGCDAAERLADEILLLRDALHKIGFGEIHDTRAFARKMIREYPKGTQ